MAARLHTALRDEPLSIDAAQTFVTDPAAGATVVFTGTVRDHSEGRSVAGLTYESFAERAAPQLAALAAAVADKWPTVRAVWMEHRVGHLAVTEPAVVVAASADHRPEAFEAARYAIDTLKATVAIWKREHWAGGGDHWPGAS